MITHLEAKRYGVNEWNKKIMPLVKRKALIESINDRTFLIYGQIFVSDLVDTDNTKYRCTGWETRRDIWVDVVKVN